MKTLLIPILAGCGALLPFNQTQAAELLGESFGGFSPGFQFTLTVTERSSTKTSAGHITKDARIPDGIPDFNIGKKVTLTIGKYGQLKGDGFSIHYKGDKPRVNFYSNNPDGFSSSGAVAAVRKTDKNKPTIATITFYKYRFSGFIPVMNSVTYVLD